MKRFLTPFLIGLLLLIPYTQIRADGIISNLLNSKLKDQIELAQLSIKTLCTSLDLYRVESFRYPSTDEGLDVLNNNLKKDPWGNSYQYSYYEEESDFVIVSLGADGVKSDDDISSNDLCENIW